MKLQNPPDPVPARRTREELALFESEKTCGYCGIEFGDTVVKNFDHSHTSGMR